MWTNKCIFHCLKLFSLFINSSDLTLHTLSENESTVLSFNLCVWFIHNLLPAAGCGQEIGMCFVMFTVAAVVTLSQKWKLQLQRVGNILSQWRYEKNNTWETLNFKYERDNKVPCTKSLHSTAEMVQA